MSTIEGGMVCTNSKEIYNTIRILRSHGMLKSLWIVNLKIKLVNYIKI